MTSAGRQISGREFVGIEPDAHAVIVRAEDEHVAGAVDPRQLVLDGQRRIVGEEQLDRGSIGRNTVHDQQEARRAFLDGDPLPADFLGQAGLGERDAVLHQHLRLSRSVPSSNVIVRFIEPSLPAADDM